MSEPTIIRAPRNQEHPYFAYRRATAQDSALSWEARGVLGYLLSKPDDWIVNPSDLQQGCGRDKVYGILKELCEAKYMRKEKQHDEEGKFAGIAYVVYEQPFTEKPDTDNQDMVPVTEKPDTAKPDTAQPNTAKPDHTNKRAFTDKKTTTKESSANADGAAPAAPRTPSQAMFQAICDVFGYDLQRLTKSLRGQINRAGKELLEADFTTGDIPAIYAYCAKRYDNFKPMALSTNANDWRAHQAPSRRSYEDDAARYNDRTVEHFRKDTHERTPEKRAQRTHGTSARRDPAPDEPKEDPREWLNHVWGGKNPWDHPRDVYDERKRQLRELRATGGSWKDLPVLEVRGSGADQPRRASGSSAVRDGHRLPGLPGRASAGGESGEETPTGARPDA